MVDNPLGGKCSIGIFPTWGYGNLSEGSSVKNSLLPWARPLQDESDTISSMIMITFEDRATERQALAFLLGRFSGQVLKSGVHLVP
jgi:hypothetical protein